ncbi:MAG: M50 family metallopeptidase, partial [Acidimicrobiia bacterium]
GILMVGGLVVVLVLRPAIAGTLGVIAAILLMIMLHELGHFVMAKRAGMKVTEFFLGFGPRVWSFRRGETEYGVKALPLGGYVRIIGMTNLEVVAPEDENRAYRSKSYRQRLGVAVAGSTVHFIVAGLLLFVTLSFVGVPTGVRPVLAEIRPDSPAERAGLQVGDKVVELDGQEVQDWGRIQEAVATHPAEEVVFTVERQGQRVEVPVVPEPITREGQRIGLIGVGPEQFSVKESPPKAAVSAVSGVGRGMRDAVVGLGSFFGPSGLKRYGAVVTGGDSDDQNRLLSPAGAARYAGFAADAGWWAVLSFLVAINIFVGVFNMVPLLPLDGGHVAIATYEKIASSIKKRPVRVNVAKIMPITATVVVVLVLLGISALYLDIKNPLPNPF